MPFVHGELTSRILGAAIAVHTALGPGFIESIYQCALERELDLSGVPYGSQVPLSVTYRGADVGLHKLDLLVGGLVVVELKAVKALEDIHRTVLRSYLRAARLDLGLLLNFASPTLVIRRIHAQ